MLETLLTALTTFLATIGPVDTAILFAALTPSVAQSERRRLSLKATLIATLILLVFTLLGGPLLQQLGVSIAALQTAGGLILFKIAVDMVFASPAQTIRLTSPEDAEAHIKDDIAVFPLATPLLAGPGAMSAAILLASGTHGDTSKLAIVVAALLCVMALTLVLLLAAHEVKALMGVTAERVLVRVLGILLAAIAVEAVFGGIRGSGLLRL